MLDIITYVDVHIAHYYCTDQMTAGDYFNS